MKELTIVIPFKNESDEVEKTILEIERTATSDYDIILINDASDDGYNYDYLKYFKSNITYFKNNSTLGPALSREIGIQASQTSYVFLIDAHMRFYTNNWSERIIECIKEDSKAIYCCRCKVWNFDGRKETDIEPYYGAYLQLVSLEKKDILRICWINKDLYPNESVIDIPCVLGASYAFNKQYWNSLNGLHGLIGYSCEEQFISIKAWMSGGKCKLIKDVVIGHLFRNSFPYEIRKADFFYNKLFIIESLIPEQYKEDLIKKMKAINYIEYVRAKSLLDANKITHNFDITKKDSINILYDNFYQINNKYIDKLKRSIPKSLSE